MTDLYLRKIRCSSLPAGKLLLTTAWSENVFRNSCMKQKYPWTKVSFINVEYCSSGKQCAPVRSSYTKKLKGRLKKDSKKILQDICQMMFMTLWQLEWKSAVERYEWQMKCLFVIPQYVGRYIDQANFLAVASRSPFLVDAGGVSSLSGSRNCSYVCRWRMLDTSRLFESGGVVDDCSIIKQCFFLSALFPVHHHTMCIHLWNCYYLNYVGTHHILSLVLGSEPFICRSAVSHLIATGVNYCRREVKFQNL